MELVVRGVPEGPFLRAFEAVRKKIPAINEIPNLKIYAVLEGEEKHLPLVDLPLEVAFSFQKMLSSADTSFFYSDENQNLVLIMVNKDSDFILHNNLALRGLLAHELMHALQRYRGLDTDLKRCYVKVAGEVDQIIDELDYNKDALYDVVNKVGITSIFVLKDLFVTEELVRRGLAREILTYYSGLFGVKKKCPLPKFHKIVPGKKLSETDLPLLVDALTFELELLPTWLPFEKKQSKLTKKLKRHIEKCYESDLDWIAKHIHEIVVLYLTEFSNTCKFHRDYYRLIFNRMYAILAGIDQFSLHIREALERLNSRNRDAQEDFIFSNLVKALYLHLKSKEDKVSIKSRKELEGWMRKNLDKVEFREFMASEISKTELLKIPIFWSIKKARMEFAESPRSDFIDVAYACVEAAEESSKEELFEKAQVILTTLNVRSPYKMVGNLLELEFLFEADIFTRAPNPRVAVRLMKELKKRAILPDNYSVPLAKEIINLTFRTKTKIPEHLALFYSSLLNISPKDMGLVESTLLAMGYKLDFIDLVNREIARLS
jgi:hypothetical protein